MDRAKLARDWFSKRYPRALATARAFIFSQARSNGLHGRTVCLQDTASWSLLPIDWLTGSYWDSIRPLFSQPTQRLLDDRLGRSLKPGHDCSLAVQHFTNQWPDLVSPKVALVHASV